MVRGLLDHADRDLRVELLEPDREGEPGRAGADGDDVVLHDVAFDRRGSVSLMLAAPWLAGIFAGLRRDRRQIRRASVRAWPCRSIAAGRTPSSLCDPHWLAPRRGRRAVRRADRAGRRGSVHRIRLFGREVDSPRLSCWIGDPGRSYRYSGARFEPHPWPRALAPVRGRGSRASWACAFNSVLANLLPRRPRLHGLAQRRRTRAGATPVIASVSLGATRRFVLKHRERPRHEGRRWSWPHGSLLVMRGRHPAALPARAAAHGAAGGRAHQPDLPPDRCRAFELA